MFNSANINSIEINGLSTDPVGSQIIDAYPDARIYYVGAIGDLELPLSYFSLRLGEGIGINLQLNVPNFLEYISDIQENEDESLTITQIKTINGVIVEQNTWAEVDFISLSYQAGARSATGVLTGSAALSGTTPKTVVLEGVSLEAIQSGKRRSRSRVDTNVNIGDTVVSNGFSFIVAKITISVSPILAAMEVLE